MEGDDKHYSYEWIEKISDIVKCEKVYIFLLEEKQRPKYWIAECNPKVIHLIINNAVSPTDYYITNKQFNWLITENHHDVVQFLGKGLDLNDIEAVCVK